MGAIIEVNFKNTNTVDSQQVDQLAASIVKTPVSNSKVYGVYLLELIKEYHKFYCSNSQNAKKKVTAKRSKQFSDDIRDIKIEIEDVLNELYGDEKKNNKACFQKLQYILKVDIQKVESWLTSIGISYKHDTVIDFEKFKPLRG